MTEKKPEAMEIEEEAEEEEEEDEVEVSSGPSDLSEPPALNVANVTRVIREKGFAGAMTDEGMGPHIHLSTILGVVVIIAIGVGVWSMM